MIRICLVGLIYTMVIFPNLAHATIGDQLDTMFESMGIMSSANAVRRVEGEGRNYYSMGSFNLKFPRASKNYVNLTAPSLSAGCGGISAYGGSFSFINADEFVQSLRRIAANSTGYLFQLALKSMCPSCAALVEELQSTINKINSLLTDECGAAEALANQVPGVEGFELTRLENVMKKGVSDGLLDDEWTGRLKKFEWDSLGKASTELGGDASSNIVWDALKGANMHNWEWLLPSGNQAIGDDMLEIMMNIVGIKVYIPIDPAPTDPDDPTFEWKVDETGLLTFEDLLYGNQKEKTFYRCPTDATAKVKCLAVTTDSLSASDLVGFFPMIQEVFLGDGGTDRGLLGKLALKNGGIDADEAQLLAMIPANTLENLQRISPNPVLAGDFAEYLALQTAYKMTELFMRDVFAKLHSANSKANKDIQLSFKPMIVTAEANFKEALALKNADIRKIETSNEQYLTTLELLRRTRN